jgi:hypothetical protein
MAKGRSSHVRPGLIPARDPLDDKIMDRLRCIIVPFMPVLCVYDFGDIGDLDVVEWTRINRCFHLSEDLDPELFDLIRSDKHQGRMTLRVENPKFVFPSIVIRDKRRRLIAVEFKNSLGVNTGLPLPDR